MYKEKIGKIETQSAIIKTEEIFKSYLSNELKLQQVKGPLFVDPRYGLNDELSGVERPVAFQYQDIRLEIVQSLAKWKRDMLGRFCYKEGTGIYVKMNAIRPDENNLSPYHSLHVDQYDWEKVISKKNRNCDFLFDEVRRIYSSIYNTKIQMKKIYKELTFDMPKEIHILSSEELLAMYPNDSPEQREQKATKQFKAIFIYGVGHKLSNGEMHGARAFDYDDWQINGDIIVWDNQRQYGLELSSMGVRVDEKSLVSQAKIVGMQNKYLQYHQDIIDKKLPYTIGGGIGRSRLNMFILEKAHIGEVNPSYWPKEYLEELSSEGIELLK